jgi:glycosyltransferase involved in cell wall biosynthesis
MTKPFFSIVIPTKNRIEPLRLAVQSVLQQEFSDWECVIVDNNDDDKVEKLFAEISDPRVRLVKTGGLHMADNWDQALQAAIGEYVVLINDKQCLYGHALLVAHQKLKDGEHELLLWGGDVLNDLDPANLTAGKGPGDRKFRVLRTDDALAECTFATRRSRKKFTSFPRTFIICSHSVVRRSTLDEIRRRTGQKICLPVNPEVTMGCHLHNHLTSYLYFDGGMSFFHALSVSSGGNLLKHKKDVNGFWASLGGEGSSYRNVPIKHSVIECSNYNDYISMRNLLGGRLSRYPLSWLVYYVMVHECLVKSHREGMDRTPELEAWKKALSGESLWMQARVRAYLFCISCKRLGRNLRIWLGLRRFEQLFKKRKKAVPKAPQKILSAASFLTEQTRHLRAIDCQ